MVRGGVDGVGMYSKVDEGKGERPGCSPAVVLRLFKLVDG